MKPLNVAISVAVLALPLCAVAQNMPNTTTTVLNQPAPTQAQDSPLVRAAKASGRLNKKPGVVITNDTLVRTGGHFTSTTINNPLPPAVGVVQQSRLVSQAEATVRARAEAEAKAKADAAAKKQDAVRHAASDYYGESIETRVDDPAMQEHQMEKMTSAPPTSAPPSKPPQN